MRTISVVVFAVLGTGCASIHPAQRAIPKGIEHDDQMLETIRTLIPDGTPIVEAQHFMESEGFLCHRLKDGAFDKRSRKWEDAMFGPQDESEEYSKDENGLSRLWCSRQEKSGSFLVARKWQVTLKHRDGKVVEVLAKHGLIGP